MLQNLDLWLLHFVNGAVGRWPLFDRAVHAIADDAFIRGSVVFLLFWIVWFSGRDRRDQTLLLCGLLGTCAALLASLALQALWPLHQVPNLDPTLNLRIPASVDALKLGRWPTTRNAFPSDTATLYFSLATTIALARRRVGGWLYTWVLIVVAIPRVYLTYHYPSDILGGLALGLCFPTIAARLRAVQGLADRVLSAFSDREYLLNALMFVLVADMANLFSGTRRILHMVYVLVSGKF